MHKNVHVYKNVPFGGPGGIDFGGPGGTPFGGPGGILLGGPGGPFTTGGDPPGGPGAADRMRIAALYMLFDVSSSQHL